jgi:hypothetical protein
MTAGSVGSSVWCMVVIIVVVKVVDADVVVGGNVVVGGKVVVGGEVVVVSMGAFVARAKETKALLVYTIFFHIVQRILTVFQHCTTQGQNKT